ncbi:Putative DNA ligase-like protein Rv0938/MT0965 [Legionella steigerwaltii]|uniref:ATP-dependent DNA ligase YkoU n=1 Tax=Legionella steigerwaltii TaxID=460 RepID=A0A378LEC4_9GAMM|nr:non-homologous end-joining DNA ligase [Legionella steigerwaltii]KTD78691.1 putative ATP-dependent DNA ligase YkoU [Legionella steigerwaltii]STY24218.1 Putative DNA ligase-like protein Rv0938/MT0965 [Legionella steigerwaltii]
MKIAGVDIPHADKLLYPDDKISKKEVVEYFYKIADHLLPFVQNRPISLKRYPNGINEEGFYNKHRPDYFPGFIEEFTVPTVQNNSEMKMTGIRSKKALIYLAGQNTLELHTSLSTMSALEKPDQIIFDLDPQDNDFEKIRKTAFTLKKILDEYEITTFVKTSGSRGLHIHLPIKVHYKFDLIKKISKKIAEKLHQQTPQITTLEQRKDKRGNKVFIDFLRNDYAMTAIAPYSLRAKKGAPIATPLEWEELNDNSLNPQSFHINNIFQRLANKENPWKNFNRYNRHIELHDLFN